MASCAGPVAGGVASPRTIRVLLADDHPIVRGGLVAPLCDYADIDVIAEAADGQMALELARQLRQDVVIMDVTMPRMNGIGATRLIVSELPGIQVIGLSMHGQEQMAASMRRAGAVAHIHKGGPPDVLIVAFRQAIASPGAGAALGGSGPPVSRV